MDDSASPVTITIRPAISADADGIARMFLESAEHHAILDPQRYWVPRFEPISARYREGQQHPPQAAEASVTLVAESHGEIVGFVDVRIDRSPDPMHREMTYCHIIEIAVSQRHRNRGIGAQLLHAAEDWGRRQGATFASLDYHSANTRAASFYQQRMGYHVASITAIKRL
jgi:ribosomal protein S18 acetylase RimI-like enzyme